jgi:hypothetical protein
MCPATLQGYAEAAGFGAFEVLPIEGFGFCASIGCPDRQHRIELGFRDEPPWTVLISALDAGIRGPVVFPSVN